MLDSVRRGQFGVLFAELMVLVIGILVALGIDQWRQDRDDRIAEREYLLAIKSDLQNDLQSINERIFPEIELRMEKSAHLRTFTPDDAPETLEEQRAFIFDINQAGFMNTFQPRRNAMDDLLATGNLRLIRNRALRLELLNFYSEAERWEPYD